MPISVSFRRALLRSALFVLVVMIPGIGAGCNLFAPESDLSIEIDAVEVVDSDLVLTIQVSNAGPEPTSSNLIMFATVWPDAGQEPTGPDDLVREVSSSAPRVGEGANAPVIDVGSTYTGTITIRNTNDLSSGTAYTYLDVVRNGVDPDTSNNMSQAHSW